MKFFYLAHGIMSLVCLRNLIDEKHYPDIVVIHKDYEKEKLGKAFFEPIEELCSNSNIPLIKAKSISDYKDMINGYDCGFCVGFMEIIKKDIFVSPIYGILNLHCGKLPQYRGRAPISRTIMNGDEYITLSIHKMDEGVDSGDILLETEIKIEDSDDVNSIYKKCSNKSASSVIECIRKIKEGNPIFIKQNISPNSKANRKISDEERKINWDDSIKKIHNLIRAIKPPYPGAISTLNKTEYIFIESEIDSFERNNSYNNGEILNTINESLLFNCSNGKLKIKKISDINLQKVNLKKTFKTGDVFK